MEIQDGAVASTAYTRMIAEDTPQESERVGIKDALLAYCARDTDAMAGAYEALIAEAKRKVRWKPEWGLSNGNSRHKEQD